VTTDELLEKLNEEYVRLESELPKAYEEYGKVAYKNANSPSVLDPCGNSYREPKYERDQIENRLSRQKSIRDLLQRLNSEVYKHKS
jgi:hypothetical protein